MKNLVKLLSCAVLLIFTSLAYADDVKVYDITADELSQAFKENQLKAETKYGVARLYIKGKVHSVGRNADDKVFIELSGDKYSIPIVNALLKDEYASKAAELNKGDKITILCFGAEKPHMVEAYLCRFP